MSRVAIEIVFDIPEPLRREPKEVMWFAENADYKCLKFHHINRIYFE